VQISLLAGKNFSETVGIPDKGVPSIKVSQLVSVSIDIY